MIANFWIYDYFLKEDISFDNLPTPSNYLLVQEMKYLFLCGAKQFKRKIILINKDGMIFYENIGFISLSNLTLTEVKNVLVEKLSNVFSTLQSTDNPTDLSVELGKLKSINIYVTGQVNNPRINLIHLFQTYLQLLFSQAALKLKEV